jgi:hypothetical protein
MSDYIKQIQDILNESCTKEDQAAIFISLDNEQVATTITGDTMLIANLLVNVAVNDETFHAILMATADYLLSEKLKNSDLGLDTEQKPDLLS